MRPKELGKYNTQHTHAQMWSGIYCNLDKYVLYIILITCGANQAYCLSLYTHTTTEDMYFPFVLDTCAGIGCIAQCSW